MNIGSSNTTFVRREQEFEVFALQSECVEISVVPELGAKVISLVNRRTGREWMWHPAGGLKLFYNQPGDDFTASTLVGWDECLPTIASCVNNGRQLPDHGEVWSVPWQLDPAAWRQGKLKTSVSLAVTPLNFARTIELRGNVIQLHYELFSRSDEPEHFVWAMHPLVPVFPGDELEFTAETRAQLTNQPWIKNLDFGTNQPACGKTFAGPLREGRAAIANSRSGDRMTFSWDTRLNDTLGLWLTRGGWNGHHHLALEPSNGGADSLAVARMQNRCGIIPAHGTLSWQATIQIDPGIQTSNPTL